MKSQPAPAPARPSRRAPLIGAALALTVGLAAGGLLKAGRLFDPAVPAPLPAVAIPVSHDDSATAFMTDASGRIPDYVIGTDVTAPAADPGFQPAAFDPGAEASPDDWTTAPPSIGGDILAMGEPAAGRDAISAAPAIDTRALDASEVAASGATGRVEPAVPAAAPEQSEADRRDGEAALAAAGFATP